MMIRCLIAGLLTGVGCAQAAASTDETVIVSAVRSDTIALPNASRVDVIDRDEIEASGATSLAELLRGRAGIHITDPFGDGSNATIDMRGFGATASANTLVMVDGRKLNPSSDAASLYLATVDLDEIERIEVVHGSAGILFGNQAVGGAVNLITRRPGNRRLDVGVGAGSFATRLLRAGASERLPSGLGYRLHASRRDTDNYRDNNAARARTLSTLVDWQRRGTRLFAEFDYLDDHTQTPGALFLDEAAADRRQAPFADDFLDTRSRVARLGFSTPLSERWRLEAEGAYRNDDRDFVQSFRTFAGTRSTQQREVWDLTPRLLLRERGTHGERVLTLGADLQDTDYLLTTAFGPQQIAQRIVALYAQWSQPLADDWRLVAGARHAQVDNDVNAGTRLDDDVTIGSLGLIYTPTPDWELHLRADQNYRFAKVDEHTNVVFGQPIGLTNQTGLTLEAGADWQRGGQRLSLLAYRLELDDEISFDASGFVNVNLDRTRRRGIQIAAESALGRGLRIGGSYDWIDSEITAGPNAGNPIPLVPEHRGRVYVGWQPTSDWSATLDIVAVDEQAYGGDFAGRFAPLPGYTVVNLGGRWQHGGLRINLRVDNLLDARYSETGNIGSDVVGSGHDRCISGAFADSCPAVNPAPERSFWLSLTAAFGP